MLMPAQIVRAALVLAAIVALAAIVIGSRQASVDVTLVERDGRVAGVIGGQVLSPIVLVAGARRMTIEPDDLVRDSDTFSSPAALHHFYLRQTALAAMMRVPGAYVDAGGRPVPVVAHRGIGNVLTFWTTLLPGLIGLMISAMVWAASPRSLPNQLVAVTGFVFPFVTAGIAITVSRDIAIDGDLFRRLFHMHEVSGLTFAIVMVALFCVYPRRIVPPRWLRLLALMLFAWGVMIGTARWAEWTDPNASGLIGRLMELRAVTGGSQVLVCLLLVALCAALAVQFRVTRGDPLARAALTWFGLSAALGAGGTIAIVTLPNVLGWRVATDASIGFPILLLIYAGLTLGMMRYRLFEAKTWSFRILFAACATAALWLVDAGMIYGLGLDQGPALGLSLVLVGFAYQPARAWLAAVVDRDPPRERDMFATAIDVAFAAPALRVARWRAMIQRSFDPLEIDEQDAIDITSPAIIDDGLTMIVPDPVAGPALRLRYPGGGKRLFAPADLALVNEMASLCRQAAEALQSYDRGAADERRRMAQDLHDDVGARLLSGIHIAQGPVRTLLQDALRDIRTLVTGLIGETAPIARVIADVRHETASRLEAAGIALDWPILVDERAGRLVPYPVSKAITSVLREAVSNTIRHAGATRMTVRITLLAKGGGTIEVHDDGRGCSADRPRGNGLNGIAARMAQIGGTFTVANRGGGTHLTMTFPLAALPSAEPQYA